LEQSQKALLVAVLAMLQYVTIQQNKHMTKAIMQIPLCCEWLAARIVKEAADSCKRKPRLKSQNHANRTHSLVALQNRMSTESVPFRSSMLAKPSVHTCHHLFLANLAFTTILLKVSDVDSARAKATFSIQPAWLVVMKSLLAATRHAKLVWSLERGISEGCKDQNSFIRWVKR